MSERDDEDKGQGVTSSDQQWLYQFQQNGQVQVVGSEKELSPEMIRDMFSVDGKINGVITRTRVTREMILAARQELLRRKVESSASDHVAQELRRQIVRWSLKDALVGAPADPLSPPKNMQFILTLLTSREAQEEIIGDLDERFLVQIARFGLKRARVWYRWHTMQIALAFGLKRLGNIIGLAKVFGLLKS